MLARQLAFQGHSHLSDRWILHFFSIMKTRYPYLSRDTKISSIRVPEGIQMCNQSKILKKTKLLKSVVSLTHPKGLSKLASGP